MTNIVKQADRDGLYTSDVIGNRYQVLESDIFRGSYFVYDLSKDDMLRSRDNSCKYFDDIASAMAVIENTTSTVATKIKTERSTENLKIKTEKPTPEFKSTEPKVKKASANSMIIELIKTTNMTDEDISIEVLKFFPDCKTTKPYDVKYRRRKIEEGKLY